MPTKTIRFKRGLKFILIFSVLLFFICGIVLVSFRQISIAASKEKAHVIAKTIRDGLTTLMKLGVIQERDYFIDSLMDTKDLKDIQKIKIIRGNKVIQQFGPPRKNEYAETTLEFSALESGQLKDEIKGNFFSPTYDLVIPYTANDYGKINCLECHRVKKGDVLGAISMTFDLSNQRGFEFRILLILFITSLIIFILIYAIVNRFLKPYNSFFTTLQQGFQRLEKGQLDEAIDADLYDEAGEVARRFNTMQKTLAKTFREISNKVFILVGYEFFKTGNSLKDTIYNVDQLVKIYNFKSAIEMDRSKQQIYDRVQSVLGQMGLERFFVYDVNLKSSTFALAISNNDQEPDHMEFDNSNKILDNNDLNQMVHRCDCPQMLDINNCRAKRTRSPVDSYTVNDICDIYHCVDSRYVFHKCIPIFGSATGTIIQIIYQDNDVEYINAIVPYIKSYIHEATRILDIMSAMEYIREQALIDDLTGLYNRKILTDLSTRLVDQHIGKKHGFGVLMIDADHFKNINDQYGHDIGDLVLQHLSKKISASVRESDIVIRFGGEEILVLVIDVAEGAIMRLAEKIRQTIDVKPFLCDGNPITQTVSIGCAEFPKHSDDLWDLIKFADLALYKAKEAGRNQVVNYTAPKGRNLKVIHSKSS